MKGFYLVLLIQFLSVQVRAGPLDPHGEPSRLRPLRPPHHLCTMPSSNHRMLPLENVKMRIMTHCEMISRVNLKRIKRVLANKYLPVWTSIEQVDIDCLYDGNGIERIHDVMEQLGEFTTYHDIETSSAAIYFHNRHEFDGMIAFEFLIRHLPINAIDATEEAILKLNRDGVYNRPMYTGHKYDCREGEDDPRAGVIIHQGDTKTFEGRVYDGYPEVLVIVSWSVARDWVRRLRRSAWYTTIVSHVLTLFNGIDMIYSKLQNTKIQINIAGIIIEEGDSFLFLEHCYYTEKTAHESSGYKLDGECVNSLLRTYLYGRKNTFPSDSYDIVVYLTREEIFIRHKEVGADGNVEKSERIDGISGVMKQLYEYRSKDIESILVTTVTYTEYLDNYPTIAHEIAHLMTVMHDKLPYFNQNKKCIGKLLKTDGGWCDNCLTWSEFSEESFKQFFSSPNCCSFVNKPRSLNPPRRQLILTADEQCRCYGYESAKKFTEVVNGFCASKLPCEGGNDKTQYTVIPMDGTPCREHQVCWGRRCQSIEFREVSSWLQ